MLLCRAATALLVVREPRADPQRCLANLLLPVAPYEATTVQAAGWALKLMSQNGLLRVLAIGETARAQLDQEVQERNIIEMDAEKFAGLYRPELAGLVAAPAAPSRRKRARLSIDRPRRRAGAGNCRCRQ